MRILSIVAAGLLALSISSAPTWAGSTGLGAGDSKSPAAKCAAKKCSPATDKPKPAAKAPAKKPGEVNVGSAARQELLKKRLQDQSKSVKGKTGALPKKTLKKS
jgi:hypothetical protein